MAVKAPLKAPLTYRAGEKIEIGSFVQIPLGSRTVRGLILSKAPKPSSFTVKEILEKEEAPALSKAILRWTEWMADYYGYPIGLAAALLFPPKKLKKPIPKHSPPPIKKKSFLLNEDQKKCVRGIQKTKTFSKHLLFGVTGSGKTEVYLELIQDQIKKGGSVLVLVPEISLTPQLFSRFNERFPGRTALLHSGISPGQKYKEWIYLIRGEKPILLGARSALFCPLPRLSLIIVDEEHESHFKQDEKLKYHAKDAAIMLAQFLNIPIVLGSATPSLESWNQVLEGRCQKHVLKKRFQNYPLPRMKVIDLKKEEKKDFLPFWLSFPLYKAIQKTLADRQQAALFLNRRGQAGLSLCAKCGKGKKCENCDISLVLHFDRYLVCHYCNYSCSLEGAACSFCLGKEFKHIGLGTETVHKDIKKLFPKARLGLADSDHIENHTQFSRLVDDMAKKKMDILIGTQMIAKGLDFPGLNLVGFILADSSFYAQDFRSSERCYQLITQMAGRSGRRSSMGRAMIQTFNPDHYAIKSALSMDFEKMAALELKHRKSLGYPPYKRLALVRIESLDRKRAEKSAKKILEDLKKRPFQKTQYLGPAKAPIFKLRSRYRFHILIKCDEASLLQKVCRYLWSYPDLSPQLSGVRLQINKDPVGFF